MIYTTQQLIDMSLTVYDLRTALQKFYSDFQKIDTSSSGSDVDITSTDELAEGTKNLYFTAQRVRNTAMQGIVFTDATTVTASDTVLTSIGKLQAQASSYGNVVTYNIGTSGAAVPLLSTENTWSMTQTFSGGLVGSLTGNASTASQLNNSLTINGTSYNGSAAVSLTIAGTDYTAGAGLSLSGTNEFSLSASGVAVGTYLQVEVDSYGRVTGGSVVETEATYSTNSASLIFSNGSMQQLTLTANSVLSCDLENGQSMTVLLPATSYTLDITGFTQLNDFAISTTTLNTLVLMNFGGTKYISGMNRG